MNPLVIPVIALLIPIVIVPAALGIKFAQRQRELEHAERMRALELGRTLPQDEPWWSPSKIAATIGAGVPVGSSLCAWLATESSGYHEEVWLFSGMVGVAGVICGSILAAKQLAHRAEAERAAASANAKPLMDSDAFDVVGSRG
jgi:hypothetical protein